MTDLLDLLNEEKTQEHNKELKVDSNSQIKQITRGLKKACYWYDILCHGPEMWGKRWQDDEYMRIIKKLCFINAPEALDIDCICPNEFISTELLKKTAPHYIDTFISEYITALANCTKRDKVLINLTKINELIEADERLDYLCHDNEKEIVIIGDVGYHLGKNMINGSITINGDVKGNVGDDMMNGVININCKPGKKRYELNGYPEGGEIYYNKKLIFKDGKLVKFEGDSDDDDY